MSKNLINNIKILCLIPAYNEYGNLPILTQRIYRILHHQKIHFNILYILQGNQENLRTIKKLQNKYSFLHYLFYPQPLGIGNAYKKGFAKISNKFTHVLTLDADLNHQPEEIPIFIKAYQKTKADLIIGSRFTQGGKFKDKRLWKRVISYSVNLFIKIFTKNKIHDSTSGFRLIKRETIEKIRKYLQEKDYPSYMEFALLTDRLGLLVKEVPIVYVSRSWGRSKMKKINTLVSYFKFFYRILFFKYPN